MIVIVDPPVPSFPVLVSVLSSLPHHFYPGFQDSSHMGHGRNDLATYIPQPVCSLYELQPLQTQPPRAEVTGRIAFLFQVSHKFPHTALLLLFRLKACFPTQNTVLNGSGHSHFGYESTIQTLGFLSTVSSSPTILPQSGLRGILRRVVPC